MLFFKLHGFPAAVKLTFPATGHNEFRTAFLADVSFSHFVGHYSISSLSHLFSLFSLVEYCLKPYTSFPVLFLQLSLEHLTHRIAGEGINDDH